MASITYAWNPFQERVDCNIANEIIKKSTDTTRVEFVPRAAPFFSHNFSLYQQGNPTPLKLGVDYVFGHLFKGFVQRKNRNAFGSVILLKDFGGTVLSANYDTIGGPFVLDEVAFTTLVGNIANGPRQAYWEDLVSVPTEWPVDPHAHPAAQTYDYLEMMDSLTSLILAVTNSSQSGPTLQSMLEEHLKAALPEAHTAEAADVGLGLTPNMEAADIADLVGNSGNRLVTIEVLKEALRQIGVDTQTLGSPPEVAQVAYFATDTPPSGWLVADGSEVSRSTYPALFERIGIKYGAGDGLETFNLPDLTDTFIKGSGASRAVGSTQDPQIPDHYHGTGIFPEAGYEDNWWGILRPWKTDQMFPARWVPGNSGDMHLGNINGVDTPNNNQATATTGPISASGDNSPANTALLPCIRY